MRKIVSIFSIVVLFGWCCIASARTTSTEEAVRVVKEALVADYPGTECELWIGSEDDSDEWLVMADPTPLANWGHKVTYYFVPKFFDSDLHLARKESHYWRPNIDLTLVKEVTGMLRSFGPYIHKVVPTRDVPVAKHQYAVILSGGKTPAENSDRYWNDCSYIYRVLKHFYNVPAENIYVAMSDGQDPGIDQAEPPFNQSQNLDLDGDEIADIEYAATISDLEQIFSSLKNKVTKDDHLLFYVIDHGGYDDELQSSYICLWGEDVRLYPNKLNDWFNNLEIGSINCVFGQCFSGGFEKPLRAPNRIIACACAENEVSYSTSDRHFDAFVDVWTTALMNADVYYRYPVKRADSDEDNHVNMIEAFNFAYANDEFGPLKYKNKETSETPQFYFGYDILARDLCIDRLPPSTELIVRDSYNDVGIMPSSNIDNNSPDVWIRNSNDDMEKHQNPIFSDSRDNKNYVYVKVHNKSVFDYDPSKTKRYLHLNWAKGAPAHKFNSYTGQLKLGTSERPGGAIKSVLIDQYIESKDSVVISVPWQTYGTLSYLNNEPISILASISDQPYGLAYDVTRNFYDQISSTAPRLKPDSYNSMAVKSLMPISSDSKEIEFPIYVQNLSLEEGYYTIEAILSAPADNDLILKLHLPDDVTLGMPKPKSADRAQNVVQRVIKDELRDYTSYDGDLIVSYLKLGINDLKKLDFSIDANASNVSGDVKLTVEICEYPDLSPLGYYTYEGKLENGSFIGDNSSIKVKKLGAMRYLLSADNDLGIASSNYHWYNECGAVIANDNHVELDVSHPQVVTLQALNNGVVHVESIKIVPEYEFANASRTNANGESVHIELNMDVDEAMEVRITPLNNPMLSETYVMEKGARSAEYILPNGYEEFIVLTLIRNGCAISSKIIR